MQKKTLPLRCYVSFKLMVLKNQTEIWQTIRKGVNYST